jgi:hypothetical protein
MCAAAGQLQVNPPSCCCSWDVWGPVTQPGGHQEVLPTTSGSDHARGGGCSGLWRRTADCVLSCSCQWVCQGGASPQVCCFLGGEHGVLDLPAWSLPGIMDWYRSRPVLMSGAGRCWHHGHVLCSKSGSAGGVGLLPGGRGPDHGPAWTQGAGCCRPVWPTDSVGVGVLGGEIMDPPQGSDRPCCVGHCQWVVQPLGCWGSVRGAAPLVLQVLHVASSWCCVCAWCHTRRCSALRPAAQAHTRLLSRPGCLVRVLLCCCCAAYVFTRHTQSHGPHPLPWRVCPLG